MPTSVTTGAPVLRESAVVVALEKEGRCHVTRLSFRQRPEGDGWAAPTLEYRVLIEEQHMLERDFPERVGTEMTLELVEIAPGQLAAPLGVCPAVSGL